MQYDGYMTRVYSSAPRTVGAAAVALISDEQRFTLRNNLRHVLLPIREESKFVVGVPGFGPTYVHFRSVGTAAVAVLSRGVHVRRHEQGGRRRGRAADGGGPRPERRAAAPSMLAIAQGVAGVFFTGCPD